MLRFWFNSANERHIDMLFLPESVTDSAMHDCTTDSGAILGWRDGRLVVQLLRCDDLGSSLLTDIPRPRFSDGPR